MAEIGLAVLSPFLEVLFDRVASRAVLAFFKAKKLDDGLLRKLKITLLVVAKVLDDAEVKQITHEKVKKWVEELQDAVYDAEDLLDAVNTEAMLLQMEKESQPKKATSKLKLKVRNIFRSFTHSTGEIETKLKEILERLEDIVKPIDLLGLKEGVTLGVPENPNKKWPTTSLPDPDECVYGRDNDKESVKELLLAQNSSDDKLSVITIKGMGGMGKTTLARFVYNDDEIVQHFNLTAWVCISEEFDVVKVTKTILEKVTSSPSVTDDLDLMQVKLKENLVGKRFLLVLDDVWNENREDWELLKKPLQYGLKGSNILVTTRNEGVAEIMRTVPTHSLDKLSYEDSWKLFAKYAFEDGESQAKQDLKDKILKKCGGLPLAAKALGGLLRDKKTEEEWINIVDSNVWDLEDKNCNILGVLRVSYHFLPPRLKRCFAFASIFPKDYEFKKDELILLWAAQSFFPEGKNVHDEGGRYFNQLLSRSFFQRSSSKRIDYSDDEIDVFVMHDLMHDLATFVSGQSCRCCENPKDIQGITKTTRHMSYSIRSTEQFQTLPATNTLRTFAQLKYFVWEPPKLGLEEISDVLVPRFKLLRVLSLREYGIVVLPETIGSLKHLRYFDLSKTKIKKLPNSICNLYNLQTLILANCWLLIELPTHMCKLLVNLHTLDVTGCENLREMPRNLGKLKELARLGRFVVGVGSNVGNIRDLGPLSNLGGELSIFSLQNVVSGADAAEARLKDKKYLETLELLWDFDEDDARKDYEVLEKLQPHRSLKRLAIKRYMGERFPNWIEDQIYSNMVSLILEDCEHCRSIPALWLLPSLKELYIKGFTNLEKLDSEFYGNSYAAKPFGSLEILSFKRMPQWKEWFHRDCEAFPLLRELLLNDCPKLRGNLPAHLPFLIKLKIDGCPDLAVSLPEAPALSDLDLVNSNEMLLNEMLASAAFSSTIKSLTIVSGCDSLQSFPLQKFPRLARLLIMECRNLESFSSPDGTILQLTYLTISGCNKFLGCSEGGLPTSLKSLWIFDCDEFMKVLLDRGGLHGLNSLTFLLIVGKCQGVVSFPAEGILPKSLEYLWIEGFDDLERLEHKGFEHLTSLSTLHVWECRKLKCIPPEGLPASLTRLAMEGSRVLEGRLKRDGGEDWDKIAHIPQIVIGGKLL